MKIKDFTMSKIITHVALATAFVFVALGFSTTALAQYSYDYGGYDYTNSYGGGYSYDYGGYDYTYDNGGYNYDYGGYDYTYNNGGYNYDYGGYDYTYDNGGYNYDYGGYDYTYNNGGYNYDYGGYDYTYDNGGYNYDYGYTYDYDYGNYGYANNYTPSYNYPYNYGYNYGYNGNYNNNYNYEQRPRCRLTVDDLRIAEGESTILRWQTWNADDVDINEGIGGVNLDGEVVVSPNETTTYVLDAENEHWIGSDEHVTCTVVVRVENPTVNPVDQPRCDSFTISDDDVSEGDYVTIYWSTSYADRVEISNGVGSNLSSSGSRSIQVFDDELWTLRVTNGNGSDICEVSVDVDPDEIVSCDYLTLSDTRVDEGDYVTLDWGTTNADDVDINNGVGDVSDDGSERVRVYNDTTFTLTARGNGDTDICRATVYVDEDDNDDDEVSCDSFTVSDSRVDEGDYVTLRWRTTNADDVDINNGVGDVSDDGSERVRVYNDTTFRLTARDNNDSDSCTVRVRVDEDDNDDEPRCRLTISDVSINSGDRVTLSWNNDRTDRAILRDDSGREILDTRDDRQYDEDRDDIELRPSRSTDYTMTVYNGNERRTCTVGTDVGSGVVAGIRFQETIPLGGTPYTGFEAGPVLTTIFYIVVVIWGAVIGYMLVLRKRGEHSINLEGVEISPVFAEATMEVEAQSVSEEANHSEEYQSDVDADKLVPLQGIGHKERVLFSGDALSYIYSAGVDDEDRTQKINTVIRDAKKDAPNANEWVTINKMQVIDILS